jgi:hypothetical protein
MASDKKRRKMSKRPRKPGAAHPDGDRRRKEFGAAARQATADKKARREFWGVPADDAASGAA